MTEHQSRLSHAEEEQVVADGDRRCRGERRFRRTFRHRLDRVPYRACGTGSPHLGHELQAADQALADANRRYPLSIATST